ncbi:MAG TPA: hypothetical protein VFN30_01670 [Chitinophagaceae bacterium]|nr:hypothetical protein [Chitinophagaceae bacterium]
MKQAIVIFAIGVIAYFISCGPTIYKSTQMDTAVAKHKIVAIIPSDVNIKLRPNETKKITPEEISKNEESTGLAIQDKMYSWFLRRSEKYAYTVKFQDVSKTNALLKEAGITYTDLRTRDKVELAKLLGVDAVITSITRLDKPMSEGASVALGVLFGFWGTTNKAIVTINIHEGLKGDLIWKYDYEARGSVGSSPDNLVNALMRNVSKKFPYNSKGN